MTRGTAISLPPAIPNREWSHTHQRGKAEPPLQSTLDSVPLGQVETGIGMKLIAGIYEIHPRTSFYAFRSTKIYHHFRCLAIGGGDPVKRGRFLGGIDHFIAVLGTFLTSLQ
ncbi:unnamed protein product [Taenia asiatica]|uniref:Uncharacterized protein n=1 Tax=Taenia asiatica TaxID=60517 RepID=A0A0R3W744_TAEAS|nr:unnamed protein product [Taenia asiatica]